MFIQITDPGDNSRILLNASCIMMVRCSAQGGSTVYLSTSASHHPDVLLARETQDQILGLLRGEVPTPGVSATPTMASATPMPAH